LAPREEHSTKEAMDEYNIKFWHFSAAHGGMKQMEM
jgi:hypothetical protein